MTAQFNTINDWLDFVITSSEQELIEFFQKEEEEKYIPRSEQIVEEDNLNAFKSKIQGHKKENELWEQTIYAYRHPLPDGICMYLISNQIAISALGHSRQSDKILRILGDYIEEAALTLGKAMYTQDIYSADELKEVLNSYYNNYWLWESLLYQKPSSQEKFHLFNTMLNKHAGFDRIKEKREVLQQEEMLQITDSVEVIIKFYRLNQSSYLHSLALNSNTPINILQELSCLKGLPLARAIRSAARDNLKIRSKD